MRMLSFACIVLASCAEQDSHVLCSERIDDLNVASILDQLAITGEPLLFHGHKPGHELQYSTVELILSQAKRRGLPVIRYDQIPTTRRGAVALAIDDNSIDDWYALRPLLHAYDAHITFFVSRWSEQGPQQVDELMQLNADGHELEPHTVNHMRPLKYVREHGLNAWLADEVDPSIQIMRDAGLTPTVFAYPFGERDDELDAALLMRVPYVRATIGHCK